MMPCRPENNTIFFLKGIRLLSIGHFFAPSILYSLASHQNKDPANQESCCESHALSRALSPTNQNHEPLEVPKSVKVVEQQQADFWRFSGVLKLEVRASLFVDGTEGSCFFDCVECLKFRFIQVLSAITEIFIPGN